MKILITGATGFIGKRLVRRLSKSSCEIICTGRSATKLAQFPSDVKTVNLDISDGKKVFRIIQDFKPNLIFHCAAATKTESKRRLQKTNIDGTKHILSSCLSAKVSRIIYLSSISVIAGNDVKVLTDDLPFSTVSNYGYSKIIAEKIVQSYRSKGLKVSILRPALVYGEEDTQAISFLVDLIAWRLVPIFGQGNNCIPLVYIDNVIDVMIHAMSNTEAYEGSYIIADKESVTVKEMIEYISELWDVKKPIVCSDFIIPLLKRLPFVGRKFNIYFDKKTCNIDRLEQYMGYVPQLSFYEGMRRVVNAHKNVKVPDS